MAEAGSRACVLVTPCAVHGSTSAVAIGIAPSLAAGAGPAVATLLGVGRDCTATAGAARMPALHRTFGGFQRQQPVGDRRLALVEALGVEGLRQPVELVVEMVAPLVGERAQEALERDDLLPPRGAHPDGDPGAAPGVLGFVEPVQLAVVVARALRQYDHADRGHRERTAERVVQLLAERL